jgi:hypothetical protein
VWGEWFGTRQRRYVAPTGKTIRGIHHVRVRDGRIVEHWQGPDILAMLVDMGLFPPTPA